MYPKAPWGDLARRGALRAPVRDMEARQSFCVRGTIKNEKRVDAKS